MSVPAVYLPDAEDDIVAAHEYYELQRVGLGDQFLDKLLETVNRIQDNPQAYGTFLREIRAAPLNQFPYVVYYRDRGSDALIIAVQHGRRSTRAWRRRIKS